MREKPKTPPSASEECEKASFKASLKILSKDKNYLLLTVSFAFAYSIYNTLSTLISQITTPFGYTTTENSAFAVCAIVFGVIGSIICGNMLGTKPYYKRFLIIDNVLTLCCMGLVCAVLAV